MSKENKIKLPVDRLVPGLYVDLKLSWKQHPFLFGRFKIKTADEIAIIKQLGLTDVCVYPERSDAKVPTTGDSNAIPTITKEILWQSKKDHIERATRYRSRRNKVANRYNETAKRVKNLTQDLTNAPANAMRDARDVIETMAQAFETSGDVLVNVVNLSDSNFTFYHHSLNVTVLSMIIGHSLKMTPDELRDLGMGAMLHDAGKILIPNQIVMKRDKLTNPEAKLLQTHTSQGAKLANKVQMLPAAAIDIIEHHHELMDGSGYPKGLKGDALSRHAKIVAITNLYDNLCNPINPAQALTPKAVMAVLFAKYQNRLDSELVQRLIATLGIYPPGTVVKLSDDSIGLVVAVDTKALLKPQVLLYNPEIPRNEAMSIDLTQYDELSITDVLKPGDYPSRIYDYLGIQERTGYFYENINSTA